MDEITIVFIFFALLITAVVVVGIISLSRQAIAPCSSFANTTIKNVPARCVAEFTK